MEELVEEREIEELEGVAKDDLYSEEPFEYTPERVHDLVGLELVFPLHLNCQGYQ
jgi:hypothetical protein